MSDYRSTHVPGATWFSIVNLAERQKNRVLVDNVDLLQHVFSKVRNRHPLAIDDIVVLPEHLHAYVPRDLYPADWACDPDVTLNGG